MGIVDRTLAAARSFLAAGQPPTQTQVPYVGPVADVVDDPNALAQGSRGVLGELLYSTSALFNAVTGVGTRKDPSAYNQWAVARPLQRSELYGMGRNGLIVQALAKLPNTATREGWRVSITDESVEDKEAAADTIAAYEARLGIGHSCARAITRGRQYSEGMVVLGIDDGRPMSEPVDRDNIRTIRWSAVIDARHYKPHELYQAEDENFTKVQRFLITDVNGFLEDGLRHGPNSLSFLTQSLDAERRNSGGQLLVHADRVLHFPTVDYLPLLETLQDSLGAFFESMHGIRTAARESSTVVYGVSNWLRKMWSENAMLSQLHMRFVDAAKSSMNAWVIDKQNESVDMKSRSLGGLADLANPFMVWLSAALATPVTVLWGVSPGGFGKGEAERETWHEEVRAFFRNVLAPQLYKLHGYILAAKDGCNLPYDTQREILPNDLSPPDEETRSKLRSDALNDIRQLVKDDIISRAEARPAVAALADDYFRPEIDLDATDDAKTAQVGVFTASIALMQALYPAGIPIEAGRELMLALASTFFTPENVARIFPERPDPSTGASAASGTTGLAGGDIEDDETNVEELSEIDLAWSQNPLPSDAMEAKAIAEQLGLTGRQSGRITRAHKAGLVEGWNVLGGKPRYSLSEVKRVVLQGNGKLPAETAIADKSRDAREPETYSCAVMLRAPKDVAQWVPWKAEDPSAPHVTLLYIGKIEPRCMLPVVDAIRRVLAEAPALRIDVDGVGYFDNDERIAYARVVPTAELNTLHNALASAIAECGVEIKHYAGGFTPHMTLAYLPPGEDYTGPVPPHGWTAYEIEVWYDSFALPIAYAEQPVT